MRWGVEFEDDDGMWLHSSPTTQALYQAGYAAGAFRDTAKGTKTYTLHRADDEGYPIIFETENLDELNNYINLILPPKND